jgi:cobalt-zinc-cadmium efflux system protein
MGKGHDHSAHEHGTATSQNRRRLAVTLVLAGGYMVAEVVGGLLTNSLALLADAGHMLSDVAALGLSLFALWFASRPATPQRSYGYYRAEILAALVNGATLIAIAIFIIVEAYRRLRHPAEVQGALMMGIAAGGLVVNLIGLWILNAGKSESLNVRGAWLHVLTDALGSVGAIVAGLLIWLLGWDWIDPAVSVLIALLVVYSSWSLLQESVGVLMEWAPRGLDVDEVRNAMVAVHGVAAVHDLHVWTITSGMDALSAHVQAADGACSRALLKALRGQLHERFGIEHVTLQIEPEGFEEPRPSW